MIIHEIIINYHDKRFSSLENLDAGTSSSMRYDEVGGGYVLGMEASS